MHPYLILSHYINSVYGASSFYERHCIRCNRILFAIKNEKCLHIRKATFQTTFSQNNGFYLCGNYNSRNDKPIIMKSGDMIVYKITKNMNQHLG